MTAFSRRLPFYFLLALPLCAQQYTQISGLILDSTGGVVPAAAVTVVSEDTGFRRLTHSRNNGSYSVASLLPGLYRITVRKDGFRTMIRLGVKLDVDTSTRVDYTLTVGSVQESITVEGAPAPMNTEDAAVGTLVGREWIERLPISGRGLLGLLELAPGVIVTPATRGESGQFTVNGQRPNTHYFTIDGLTVNSGVSGGGQPGQATGGTLPGMTAFGGFHQLVSLEALGEFRTMTSTVVPEFGRLPGAQVSLSSRAGSNQLHGSLFGYWRNEKLDANDWFANRAGLPRAPSRVNHYGGSVGGPVWRNRAFFFAGYENLHLRQPQTWRSAVPSLEARQAGPQWAPALFELLPRPSGGSLINGLSEWTGQGDRPARLEAGSLRLDAAPTSRVTMFARYTDAPSRTEFGSLYVNDLALRSRRVTGGISASLGAGLIQDFRLGLSDDRSDSAWRPASPAALPECYLAEVALQVSRVSVPCDSFFQISTSGLPRILSGPENRTRQRQWQVVDTVSLSRASHQFRFGADYRRLTPVHSRATRHVSVMADSLADLLAAPSRAWVISTPPSTNRIELQEISVFGQDTWRLHPRLALTYGLRWELNPPPISKKYVNGIDTPSNAFNPATNIAIWRLSYTNLAPRIGAAYRLRKDSDTVLRAGFGVYFNSSLAAANDVVNGEPFNTWEMRSAGAVTGPVRSLLTFGFAPDLRLPVTRQWNITVEHSLRGQTIAAGYVGSAGRNLLRREIGGALSAMPLVRSALTTNNARSDYHGLQLQYRRPMARRLQAIASYTWAHSIDTGSSDSAFHWAGPGYSPQRDRASSDFDVRHVLSTALSYETGSRRSGSAIERLWRGWAVDGILRARTGFPINVLSDDRTMGVPFANILRPHLVQGPHVWLNDTTAPGGRRLNRAAFAVSDALEQGNLGRNAIPGFGMSQIDLSLRRTFAFGERAGMELRVEAFNVLNRANFADPARFLGNPLFGESSSMLNGMLGSGTAGSGLAPMLQVGGPRSVQLAARFRF